MPPHQLAISSAATRASSTLSASLARCSRAAAITDPFAIADALSAASSAPASQSLSTGSQLHASGIKLGVVFADTYTSNQLLIHYSKRGQLASALDVFDETPSRNHVTWTAMVSAAARGGAPGLGLRLFASMLRSGFCPNEFALASALGACCQWVAADVKLGLSLHGLAVRAVLHGNPYVGSSLMLVYAKHGRVAAAERVFAGIASGSRDVACWNAMLEGYVANGHGYDATRTVALMHGSGIAPDMFTYISAARASWIARDLDFGRQVHGLVVRSVLESNNTSVMNALMDMYFKAGQKETAADIFGKIRWKDTVSWNTMISGLEDERAAADCFVDMARCGCRSNQVTFSVMLRLSGASLGLQIFGLAYRHGYSDNVLVANAAINMLSRCGLLSCAYGYFCDLGVRNVVTWNEMIAGYGLHGCSGDAMRLFRSLVCFGARPDEFTYPAVLSAFQQDHDARNHEQVHASVLKQGFASCQFVSTSLIKAKAALGSSVLGPLKIIQDAGEMDLVSWGVAISAFVKHGLGQEALSLFNSCRVDCPEKPDEFILGTILNACANAALIRQCRCIHSLVVRTGHSKHLCVSSALVDAYAKCGDITAAKGAFATVSTKDAIVYNTMLTAYANHGLIREVLSLYQEMTQLQLAAPTPATFVAAISACSHLGLVEQGKLLFSSMLSAHGMNPTRANYACLIDLLARRGLLEEATGVIQAMPFQPWPAVWRSLMNGCRIHGNKELGLLASEQILRMAPNSDGAYVSLSHVYAEDGDWRSAEDARRKMAENQVHKAQGYSSLQI